MENFIFFEVWVMREIVLYDFCKGCSDWSGLGLLTHKFPSVVLEEDFMLNFNFKLTSLTIMLLTGLH